jgi:hypothetical protein
MPFPAATVVVNSEDLCPLLVFTAKEHEEETERFSAVALPTGNHSSATSVPMNIAGRLDGRDLSKLTPSILGREPHWSMGMETFLTYAYRPSNSDGCSVRPS